MTARRLLVWRHGRTAWNAEGRFQGQADVPLDDAGRREAAVAARHLAARAPDVIVSSDLARARETAAAVGDLLGLSISFEPRLRELFLGRWQGRTLDEVRSAFPEEYAAWRAGEPIIGTGRETLESLVARAVPAVLEIEATCLLVVTHGGTARALLGGLLGLPHELWRTALGLLGNGRWSELVRRGERWQLVAHNVGVDEPAPIESEAGSDAGAEAGAGPDLLHDVEPQPVSG